MRRLLVVGALGTVLLLALPLAVTLTGAIGAGASSSTCGTAAGSHDVAMTALVVGTRLRASERVLLAAFEAGLVESGMANLDHGDRDSLGVLQQRPSQGWGTPEQVMDPAYAFEQFYRRAIPLDQGGYPGSAGQLAQAVQRSAFPLRYDERAGEASALLASVGGALPSGAGALTVLCGPAGADDAKAAAAVRWALGQLGKPYVWGAEGPAAFDCSGLTSAAYASVGVNIPRVSRDQFAAGPRVTTSVASGYAGLAPGDLVFFATNPLRPDTIHHVGIYLGGGKMVDAPHSGAVVRTISIATSSYHRREFAGATRPAALQGGAP